MVAALPEGVLNEQQMQNYDNLVKELEKQELESPEGIAPPQVYGQLLAVYLVQNDLPNAKLLWKRIPASVKLGSPELAKIWTVGQHLWQRDFPHIYESLAEEWPEYVKQIMDSIGEVTHARALQLVAKAYASISMDDLSQFMGMPVQEAAEEVSALGWEINSTTNMVTPKKAGSTSDDVTPSEEQLAKLTEFVAFLEN